MIRHSLLKLPAGAHARTLDVMVAASMPARMRGLLARPRLADGQAMLLGPCNTIHTLGMRYPIDVVFLRRDGLVLRVASAVPPRRMRGHWRAHCVLELASGAAARCGIEPGLVLPIGGL
jgi:uncharacterized membrane protein (UPF0127 family)